MKQSKNILLHLYKHNLLFLQLFHRKVDLQDLLHFLNFTQQNEVFTKKFISGDYSLAIDFENKQIQYPESFGLIINERQTCNFSSNENFVVFECVHRLLEKGYKP